MPPSKSRAIPCRTLRLRDFLAAIPALLAAGCGGSVGAVGGSSPDGSTPLDAGADRAAPVGCFAAAEGAPCDHEGLICRDFCPLCATCGFLGCSGGRWSAGSDFPPESCFVDASTDAHDAHDAHDTGVDASTIPCGPSPDGGVRLCAFPLEYCEESGGGPPPPPDAGPFISYQCVKISAACASSPTCKCLTTAPGLCGGAGSGAVVSCTTPDGGLGPTVSCGFP